MPERARKYWLMKSEPDVFSFADLQAAKGRTTAWDGVRNYQARNFLRAMRVGDLVLYYHSNAAPPGVAGVARVSRAAYPDATQFEPRSPYFDPGSKPLEPRWSAVDVEAVAELREFVSLPRLKATRALAAMELLRRGSRLSVQPVTAAQWRAVLRLGGLEDPP